MHVQLLTMSNPFGTATDPVARPRVLVVTPQPFYEDRGTPIALRYVLRALTELGYGVDVLAFPIGRTLDMPGVRMFRTANPFRFRSVPIGFSWRKTFLDALLWRTLRRRLKEERYLYIHAVEEAAFVAALLCRRHGPPVTYDMASSIPEQLRQYPLFRNRVVQALGRRIERWLLSEVQQVVCSAGLESHVRSLAPGKRCRTWVFPSEMRVPDAAEIADLRRTLAVPPDAKVVMYLGSFARYQGIDLLLEAAPVVLESAPASHLVLVGADSEAEARAVRDALPRPYRGRVLVAPRIDKAAVPVYLGMADILVSPRAHGRNLPLKIFDYLQGGKAIVATDIPAHRTVLDDRLAVLVEPTATALASGIASLLVDPARAARLADEARAYAGARLTWRSYVDLIGELVRVERGGAGTEVRVMVNGAGPGRP